MRPLLLLSATIALVGCAGKIDYIRPTQVSVLAQNTKEIAKSRDAVWNAAVPELGKRFFVINNLDKSSGLINLSYSGDPEEYIDCGRIVSFVQNARGKRTYDFPASSAQQSYEVMDANGLFGIDRRMSLEGRVNVIFEEVSPSQTRVTVNTRYVVQKQHTARNVGGGAPQTSTETIQFNSGGQGAFSNSSTNPTQCVATGQLDVESQQVVEAQSADGWKGL